MKKNITFLLAILTSFTLFSQKKVKGNGVNTLIETKLDSFKKIILNNEFEVTLIKAENASVEIETDENLHAEIEMKVKNDILTIETSTTLKPKDKLEVTIFCTGALNEIELNDKSAITSLSSIHLSDLLLTMNDKTKASLILKTDNSFKLIDKNKSKMQLKSNNKFNIDSPKTELNLAESANTAIDIKTDSLTLTLKKNAFLEIRGKSNYANISNQNNAGLKGKDFKVNDIELVIRDNVKSEINAVDNIKIEASDKSEIYLYGSPKISLDRFENFAKIEKRQEKIK